jgi:hypothetical protein
MPKSSATIRNDVANEIADRPNLVVVAPAPRITDSELLEMAFGGVWDLLDSDDVDAMRANEGGWFPAKLPEQGPSSRFGPSRMLLDGVGPPAAAPSRLRSTLCLGASADSKCQEARHQEDEQRKHGEDIEPELLAHRPPPA